MPLERIYDLAFEVKPDGSVELEQGHLEINRISLHACHTRTLFERAGHLLPVDELSKKLAERLCSVYLAMADDYRHLSRAIEDEFHILDGFIDGIPDAVFPHHLWDQREAATTSQQETNKAMNGSPPAFALQAPEGGRP